MRFRTRLFAAWVGLTLLLSAGLFFIVQSVVEASFYRVARDNFVATRHGLTSLRLERIRRMRQGCSLMMNVPELRALIAESRHEIVPENVVSLQERLDYFRELTGVSFVVVLDAERRAIAQSQDAPWADMSELQGFIEDSPGAEALVASLFAAARAETASDEGGLWDHDGQLFEVVAVPLLFDEGAAAPEGAMLMGVRIDDALAADLGRSHHCEITFLSRDGAVAASTLDDDALAELTKLSEIPGRAVELAGRSYLLSTEPLIDPYSKRAVGSIVVQADLAEAEAALGVIFRRHLWATLAGLALAGGVSFALSQAITRPVRTLVDGVSRVAKGDLGHRVEMKRGDELGDLASAFNDMIVQLRAREELQRLVEKTRAASESKSAFLANMSHEIRTPMTAILGFADLLADPTQTPADRLNHVETIRRNGKHLLTIINDILDLSKIEAGKMTIEQIDCQPEELIADVASLMRGRAEDKGLAFAVEYATAIPQRIKTDPTRLRQVLMNLLGNAIKFTEAGGVKLVVALEEDAEERRAKSEERPADSDRSSFFAPRSSFLRFTITDTGIGMTPEQAANLFQAFTQADASTTRKFGGTGLGLVISKRLAQALGGDVTVTSELGKGTAFTVRVATGSLDGIGLATPAERKPAPEARAEESPATGIRGARILLAEDGPDNQKLITFVLQRAGALVTLAPNGRIALEQALAARARDGAFDVILMDMQMPEMDGYEATRRLRAEGYAGPIIALTAHAMSGDRQRCLDAGCDDFATKPIDRARLLDTIGRLASRSEAKG